MALELNQVLFHMQQEVEVLVQHIKMAHHQDPHKITQVVQEAIAIAVL
jgi:hypothetical protein